jgi:hypothetical protein
MSRPVRPILPVALLAALVLAACTGAPQEEATICQPPAGCTLTAAAAPAEPVTRRPAPEAVDLGTVAIGAALVFF